MINLAVVVCASKRIKAMLFLLMISYTLCGQVNREKLEAQKRLIENEINYTNQLLNTTSSNKANTLHELILINNKINQRELLISNYTGEIKTLDRIISENNDKILEFESELKIAKAEYAKLLNFIYLNKNSTDRIMYILASSNFNQAYQRIRYLQYYSDYRKSQALQIKQMKDSVTIFNNEMNIQKQERLVLIQNQQKEMQVLQQEKQEQGLKVNNLTKQEKQLQAKIRQQKNEADRLNRAINDIISDEIKSAAATAEKSGSEKRSDIIALTPAELELSNTFSENKGKLPWPSERGIISSTFGEHDHPVLKNIKIKNNGIDILTNSGENARSVFDGKIISVRSITNTNKAIIVRHGEYFTVYSNLIEVFVKPGDEVKTRQNLGLVYTNQAEAKTELHFEIWKGKVLLNPQQWVIK